MHETCFRLLGVLTVQWANTIHKSAEALDNDTGEMTIEMMNQAIDFLASSNAIT